MTAPSIKEALEQIVAIDQIQRQICVDADPAGNTYALEEVDGPCAKISRAALATLQPSGERREAIARIINPHAEPAPGRPAGHWWREALAAADRILASGFMQDDPTTSKKEVVGGEMREAIAKALAEKWPGDYMQGDDEGQREPNALAYETSDLILASGLVQDEAAIRADEREKCAKIADLFVNHDAEYGAKYPDEAFKFDNRWLRSKTIADAIRSARDGGAS